MPALDISAVTGLSESEARERLLQAGYNELPAASRRGFARIVLEVTREPMFILLVAGATLYFVLGDVTEGLMMTGFVFLVIGITVYQERRTERALEALRNLSSPRALVVRDGVQRRIPGREVVPGDSVVLAEGDRVPADGVLLMAEGVSVDESLLTGESVPVRKRAGRAGMEAGRPGGDDQPFAYAGTLVVGGQALLLVTATGAGTGMGKIGTVLRAVERGDTRLKEETGRVVKTIALAGLFLCVLIVVVYGFTRADWIGGLLAGITLAMAILPEEFPVVLTIFLALGAWRISRQNVLTRQVPAIEALGSATVLCVDKTGTLTENRMAVAAFFSGGVQCAFDPAGAEPLPEICHGVAEFAILACKPDPFDPMEKALLRLREGEFGRTEHVHAGWILEQEYPLCPDLLAMSNVWRSPGGDRFVIAAKGAPEAIADLCHLDPARTADLARSVDAMAAAGLRVLGVAKASFSIADLPGQQHDFAFAFLGLVGFSDPVRPQVAQAVGECRAAGIRVIMITGDYPLTAENIARQIGLPNGTAAVTGPELDAMDDSALRERIRAVTVIARAVPEQKLRIVNALRANGEVVAMTGDGVNDAPALKASDIGIAMGGRGTDVAREASSLVLLDDNFTSIVAAVRLGRRIFDNLRKAMAYIISVHVPVAGMSLIPVLLGMPLVLLPVHIVFLELIIDPACSIAFEAEPEERGIMDRPPRQHGQGLFTRRLLALSFLQGFVVLAIVLAVWAGAILHGLDEGQVRALTFTTIVIANLSLILANRSWTETIVSSLKNRNRALLGIFALTIACLFLVLFVPVLRDLFRFAPVGPADLATGILAGAISVVWFEGYKLFLRRNNGAAPRV
jgi:Ca2+-transporting ATPase